MHRMMEQSNTLACHRTAKCIYVCPCMHALMFGIKVRGHCIEAVGADTFLRWLLAIFSSFTSVNWAMHGIQ